tara:strand:- start:247 stop:384 length:138 start_codon:yes stop_codon:yes gene_type:complete
MWEDIGNIVLSLMIISGGVIFTFANVNYKPDDDKMSESATDNENR